MKMSLVKQQIAFLLDVARLIKYGQGIGIYVTGGELFRTAEQQAIYMKTRKTTVKHSRHQDRLAIDFNFFIPTDDGLKLTWDGPKVSLLGRYWESLSKQNRWGGNWTTFRDAPHFERLPK